MRNGFRGSRLSAHPRHDPECVHCWCFGDDRFYYYGGLLNPDQGENSQVAVLLNELDSIYHFNIAMLIPPAIVFLGGYKGYHPVVIMITSSLAAILIGLM